MVHPASKRSREAAAIVVAVLACVALLSGSAAAQSCPTIPSADLIADWTGDVDGSDDSGNDYDVDLRNGATAGSEGGVGGDGYAFAFDGTDDIADVEDFPIPDAGTFIFWAMPDAINSVNGLFGTYVDTTAELSARLGSGFTSPTYSPADQLRVNVGSNTTNDLTTTATLNVGEWSMIVVTWDWTNDEYYLYVDGVEEDSSTASRSRPASTEIFAFGGHEYDSGVSGTTDRYFEGLIDNVRMYESVLEECQVEELYEAEYPDADSDEVEDKFDNCLNKANGPNEDSDQVDTDDDGYGNSCDPDFDQDESVSASDFATYLACSGSSPPITGGPTDDPTCEGSDFDGDGSVGAADFAIYLTHSGGDPGPSGLSCAATTPCP